MINDNNQANKRIVWDLWQAIDSAEVTELPSVLAGAFHDDVDWKGFQPVNELPGIDAVVDGFWAPLRRSFPDLARETHVFMGGTSGGDQWVSGLGYLAGTFVADWVGIPATGEKTNLRFGQFYAMRDGRVAESFLIIDVAAVMRQAGYDVLPPSKGRIGGKVPGPANRDGILLDPQDPAVSLHTARVLSAMVAGHARYDRVRDGADLSRMGHEEFWHPEMKWYGATGIGSSLDLQQFKDFHQWPWLRSFGDRGLEVQGGRGIGIDPDDLLVEGEYAALGVWDSPFSVNYQDFLDVPATGRVTTMRDFDWYRVEDGLIVENWVPMDVIDILLQMGVDVFEVLRRKVDERRTKRWFE